MTRFTRGSLVAGGAILLGRSLLAGEPPPPVLLLDAPMSRSIDYIQPNPYDVWQYYGVDRRGHFRPLVVPFPDGLRYTYNGARYPWWQNYPGSFSQTVTQPAVLPLSPALHTAPVFTPDVVISSPRTTSPSFTMMPTRQPWDTMPPVEEK